LTCVDSIVQLFANPIIPLDSLWWIGPDSFFSEEPNIFVQQAGDYLLSGIDTNGCLDFASLTVIADTASPAFSIIPPVLTCLDSVLPIITIFQDSQINFFWSGPENFYDTVANPLVSTPGKYALKASNKANCIVFDTISVASIQLEPVIQIDTLFNCQFESLDSVIFSSQGGCDSLIVITRNLYIPADSIFLSKNSCYVQDTG
jgi:hypothetical protein